MTTTRPDTSDQGFLAEICKNPEDDTMRLIYADWLEDQGDPRGEFISVQCELARLDPDDPRHPGLVERERALLARHESAWRAALPVIEGIKWGRFARGFVATVIPRTISDIARHAATIFTTQPVEELHLVGQWGRPDDLLPDLTPLPGPERWTSLVLTGYHLGRLNRGSVSWLDSARILRRLSSVTLSQSWVLGSFIAALVSEDQFGGLVSLRLRSCSNTSSAIRMLVRGPGVARLRELDLVRPRTCRSRIDTAATALIQSPYLRNLRALNLEGQLFSGDLAERLRQRFPFVRF
jgi:uncharacterized protein (TIGR02996 family)